MLSKAFLSVFLVVYFISDFSFAQRNETSIGEDYEYVVGLQGVYKFQTTKKNWRDAKQTCADEDAILFYPKNDSEANAAISFWKLHDNETELGTAWLYVGISDIDTEGVFVTIDGKSISEVYNNWGFSQPDDYNDEDCVHLSQNGPINDINCNTMYRFICEKKLAIKQNNSIDLHQPDSVEMTTYRLETTEHEKNVVEELKVEDEQKVVDEQKVENEQKVVDEQKVEDEQKVVDEQKTNKFWKDYNYIEAVESFYKIHTIGHPWAEAKRVCALEGATFWYPDDEDEAHAVISFWNATQPHIGWVYVGLSDMMAKRLFVTTDGKLVSEVYQNWLPNQPDNYNGKQHCVYMYNNGYLDDYGCSYDYSFICKKTLQSLEWNSQCNMPNLGYTADELPIELSDFAKCYKVHTTPLNWIEAYAVCRHEKSHLAVISNQLEAEYIANLTQSTLNPRVKEDYQRGIYHVGFHNRFNEGWQTVKGTAMDVDADMWWDSYKPAHDRAQCGSMFYTGRLVNTDCAMKSFFICEHDTLS